MDFIEFTEIALYGVSIGIIVFYFYTKNIIKTLEQTFPSASNDPHFFD
jgi:hypothetical protein